MRIVSVNHTADVYGASRCLERFAARAVRDGHELLVVLPGPGALKDALDAIGVTVRLHPLLTIIDRNTTRTLRNQLALLARFPLSVIWLMWTIAGFRADVVHTNGGVAIPLYWPFSEQRFFSPWRPVEVSPVAFSRFFTQRGADVLLNEVQTIWVPLMAAALSIFALRHFRKNK